MEYKGREGTECLGRMAAEEKRVLDLLTVLRDLFERRLTAPQEESMVDKLVNALPTFL